MTTGKKIEEFDGSRKIHGDNSFNDARDKLNEQKNHSSFEVSGDIADSDMNSILIFEVTLTDNEILANLTIENVVKNMKYFKKLVRQYNRANGKPHEGADSTSNSTTGDDVVVLSHSKILQLKLNDPGIHLLVLDKRLLLLQVTTTTREEDMMHRVLRIKLTNHTIVLYYREMHRKIWS